MDILADLKQDPDYLKLSVPDQIEAARIVLGQRLSQQPDYLALSSIDQKATTNIILSRAPTFADEQFGEKIRQTGQGYVQGASGDTNSKNIYEFVNGMVRGSGLLSGISAAFDTGKMGNLDHQRALDYYKTLDHLQNKGSGWATAGEFVGAGVEMAAISIALTPVSGALAKSAQFALRGGKAAVAAVEGTKAVEGVVTAGKTALTMTHPALEMVSRIGADALITAGPLYLADEYKRAAQGQPSVASQGAAAVLQTLGANAAGNFIWGTVQGGLLMAAARFGKAIFSMKPAQIAEAMARVNGDIEGQRAAFMATRDPILLSKMTPYQRADTLAQANINDWLKDPTVENPLAKAQTLAQHNGKTLERTDTGYRIWEGDGDMNIISHEYQNLNDAKDTLAFKTYEKYAKATDEEKAKYADIDKWFIARATALENQAQLLRADTSKMAKDISELEALGTKPGVASERPFITKSEAIALNPNDPVKGIAIQAKLPFDANMTANAKNGELNLFKNSGPVRVAQDVENGNVLLVGTRGATDEQYALATKAAQEVIKKDTRLSLNEARASLLLDNGIDYYRHPDSTIEFLTPRNAKLIGTVDDIKIVASVKAKAVGDASANVAVEAAGRIALDAKAFSGNPALVMRAAVQATRSRNPEEMKKFVQLFMEGNGKSVNVVVDVVKNDDWYMKAAQLGSDGNVHVSIPGAGAKTSLVHEQSYMRSLFDDLKKLAPGVKTQNSGKYYESLYGKQFTHFNPPDKGNPKPWIQAASDKLGVKATFAYDGVFLNSGSRVKFYELQDAVDHIARLATDEVTLANDFRMQGLSLKRVDDRLFAVETKTGKTLSSANDLPTLLHQMDYVPKHMPLAFGPSEVRYTPDGIEMTIAGVKSVKTASEASDIIRQFRDTKLLARQKWLKASDKGTMSVDNVGSYRVYLSKYDYVKTFDNPNEARIFLERDVPSWDNLKEMASKKNADLLIEDNRFKLRVGNETIYASDANELAMKLKNMPDIEESVPNILDSLDPSIERDVSELVAGWTQNRKLRAGVNKFNRAPEVILDPKAKQMGANLTFRASTSQFTSWIRDVANRTNRPELLKLMRKFDDGRRLAQINSLMGDKFIMSAFTQDGKMLPMESRQKVYYWMSQQNSERAAEKLGLQYQAKFGKAMEPLTVAERKAADACDQFLGDLSKKFGFEFKDLIFKYMPQIRDFNNPKNMEILAQLKVGDDLARAAFGAEPPKSIKFWAENDRTESIFEYVTKDDPLELLMLYNAQGHKKLYMNESWKEIASYLKNDPVKDQALIDRINVFRESVMGYYHSPGEKVVENFGIRFFTGLKKAPFIGAALKNVPDETLANYGKNILRNTMSASYMVQLGFKPWTAIRNSLQCMTTLAPRFGVARTMQSYDAVLKGGEEFFDGLRMRGIITEQPPIVDELAAGTSKLGKVTAASLRWLKNGDDLTRAVAYKTGFDSFQDGLSWIASHPDDVQGFQRISGLSVLDPMTRDALTKQALAGDILAAQDSFASIVVKDTAFTADSAESSMLRHGLVGKLFGQYGSYSESYRANMFNMLKYGTPADRVRMVSTYLAICGVMTSVFAAMNIKTNDFLPAGPAVFGGGPAFQAGVNLLKVPGMALDKLYGNWNIGDQTTQNELKFQLGGFVPGAYQMRYLEKAIGYHQQGDDWRTFLSVTGVPVTPDP